MGKVSYSKRLTSHKCRNRWRKRGDRKSVPSENVDGHSIDRPMLPSELAGTSSAEIEVTEVSDVTLEGNIKATHCLSSVKPSDQSTLCSLVSRLKTHIRRSRRLDLPGIACLKNEEISQLNCHFDEAQFENNRQDGVRKLRPDAVPLVFPTHILVVHDPAGKRKWHSPLPLDPKKVLKSGAIETGVSKTDHQYAKHDQEFGSDDLDETFSSLNDMDKISPAKTTGMTQTSLNGSSRQINVEEFATLRKPKAKRSVPFSVRNSNEDTSKPKAKKSVQFSAENSNEDTRSPSECPATLELSDELFHPGVKLESRMNSSDDLLKTPDVWDVSKASSPVLDSPGILKDALNFLQFMLPQKWMAFSDKNGIHVALLSQSRAKTIQRSVFTPFKSGDVELYVHATRLLHPPKIFDSIGSLKTEELNRDNVGTFVDKIVNIVNLFSTCEICCGITDETLIQEWKNVDNCLLDCNTFREERYTKTVRSVECNLLALKDDERCKPCDNLYESLSF